MSDYQEQWERVQRWFGRIKEQDQEGVEDSEFEIKEFRDDYIAFFTACYHLKDWIKNDSNNGIKKDNVENFTLLDRDLAICGDLCNGQKHMVRNHSNRSNDDAEFEEGSTIEMNVAEGNPADITVSGSWKVKLDNGEMDAFELAKNCLNTWEKYMTVKGLL